MGFSFSFKPRFVNPIRAGLGLPDLADENRFPPSRGLVKRQTIRAERKDGRRPQPGDELHLFSGMRQPGCVRIAPRHVAFVSEVRDIAITFAEHQIPGDRVKLVPGIMLRSSVQLYAFAKDDGFVDWRELREFWAIEHKGVREFLGFITFWKTT